MNRDALGTLLEGVRKKLVNFFSKDCIRELEETQDKLVDSNARVLELESRVEEIELAEKSQLPKELTPIKDIYRGKVWVNYRKYVNKKLTHQKKAYSLAPQDVSHPTSLLKEAIDGANMKSSDSDYAKFTKALIWVQQNLKYITDYEQYLQAEYFTPSYQTLVTGQDDCESLSQVVIDMCRMMGVSSEKIFMAVGYVGTMGHAWVAFKDTDKWYIGEATLSQATPPKFWDMRYVAEGSFGKERGGLRNWDFEAKFKAGEQPYEVPTMGLRTFEMSGAKVPDVKTKKQRKEKEKLIEELWQI